MRTLVQSTIPAGDYRAFLNRIANGRLCCDKRKDEEKEPGFEPTFAPPRETSEQTVEIRFRDKRHRHPGRSAGKDVQPVLQRRNQPVKEPALVFQ